MTKLILPITILTGPVHTTPEKFENDLFTLKTHKVFCPHYASTPEKFENSITSHLGFCVSGELRQGNHMIVMSSFSKDLFLECILSKH